MLDRIGQSIATCEQACQRLGREVRVMEVCGTHTVAIFRSGLRTLLPRGLRLISGPGCPVCVTDQGYIDVVLDLADRQDVIIATYGDMIRVPGRRGSLDTRAGHANIRVVLSSDDALRLALEHPGKTVVFVAVGFETTAPATAVVVKEAAGKGIENFCVLPGHKWVVPAMMALLGGMNHRIDAFLCPGHVSAILGYEAFAPIVETFGRPCVVAGFEAVQIAEGLGEICRQLVEGRPSAASVYGAVVTAQGNPAARQILAEVFEPVDGRWRGVGVIPGSAMGLRGPYRRFDAFARFGIEELPSEALDGCRCGEVLCGLIGPEVCPLFGTACTPRSPVGPCMVSSEGACAAWFKYGKGAPRS